MNESQTKEFRQFLRQSKLAVLSTVNTLNSPESALVAFAEDEKLNLYFQTRVKSRKYANILQTGRVSLVAGWDLHKLVTVQMEGIAERVEATRFIKQLFVDKKSPSTQEFLNHPDARFFKITVEWVRYSDYSTKPPLVWEHEL